LSNSITQLAEIGSTNDWLLARAGSLPDGHWVRADRQTAGRGRRGRVWNDGAGNLMASVLVRAEGAAQQLSFVAAVALREAVAEITCPQTPVTSPLGGMADSRSEPGEGGVKTVAGMPPPSPGPASPSLDLPPRGEVFSLKWPNDLLLNGSKCAGILLERQGDWLVIGFGVNLAQHPEGTERPATSLAAAGLPVPAAHALLMALAASFAHWRARWQAEGFAPIRAEWLAHAAGLAGRMVARLGDAAPEGQFIGLADDGALLLQLDDGRLRAIHAGEVFSV
jgi:BirA family biotin operon repressor/biotin-[acetyl-CoA-carboxylase] ligase